MTNFADSALLSPLDGRYRAETSPLAEFLSEAALNRDRLKVEVEWLIFLSTNEVLPGAPVLREGEIAYLRGLVDDFGEADIARMAQIEAETKHEDRKSVV